MSSSIRAIGRRQIAVVVAALLAFGGFAVYRTQTAAGAHETTVVLGLQCTVAGAMSATYTVSHDPTDGAHAGAPLTLNVATQLGAVPDTLKGIGLSTMNITIPIPDQIVAGGDIMVMGGNLTKTSQTVSGTSAQLALTAAPGVTLGTLQMPSLMFMLQVKPGATGPIVFQGPSAIQLNVNFLGTPITENCTAVATNPPLVSVPVVAATTTTTATTMPTTTASTTTTTRATTSTTRATTATTQATTSTTRATTSTTRATTSTTRATTATTHEHDNPTTTRATTSTTRATTATTRGTTSSTRATTQTTMRPPGGNPLAELIRKLICLLFRIGC